MDKGEKADFMIIVYSGDAGIYFDPIKDMENGTAPKICWFKLSKSGTVLGDKGLLL